MTARPQIKGSAKARKSAARLIAVQTLYQTAQGGSTSEQAIKDYLNHRMGFEEEGELYVAADPDLLTAIVNGVEERQMDIDPAINAALNDDRPIDTQQLLIQYILRCGVFELMDNGHIDTGIIINDYVDIAKAFFEAKEPSLVNAILDKIAKVVRQ